MSKRDKRFFEELTPLANAIKALPAANIPRPPDWLRHIPTDGSKLGAAQRKREARAARNLANRPKP